MIIFNQASLYKQICDNPMANRNQVKIIKQGVEVWNKWRLDHPKTKVDLSGASFESVELTGINLSEANLRDTDFWGAELKKANLSKATLIDTSFVKANLPGVNLAGLYIRDSKFIGANLSGARLCTSFIFNCNFREADLSKANLSVSSFAGANFSGANLSEGNLCEASFHNADFTNANLSSANLKEASLENSNFVKTQIEGAILTGCSIYGISVWSLQGKPRDQSKLMITPKDEASIYVDNLQVAQFIYLLLNRENLREVIDTITSKVVLILGRFTKERKEILDALAGELRKYNLLPVIFDFDKPTSRDFTETIKTLAGISLFVIADITNPKSSPLELQATIPEYQIPFVTIIQQDEEPFSMYRDLMKYDWVLKPISYDSKETLQLTFREAIFERALQKHQELQKKKAENMVVLSAKDFLIKPIMVR
jgi:uncharacterized protein YjbI with pentapeptide repeats